MSTVAPPVAGMSKVSAKRFLFVDGIGSALYGGCLLGFGYVFNRQIDQILAAVGRIGGSALSLLIALAVLFIAYKLWQRQRLLHELRMARITAPDLRERLQTGEAPLIFDLRSSAAVEEDPVLIQGAVHVSLEEIESRLSELPRDREIIVYCSCPNEVSSARLALRLKRKGFSRVRPLLGGIDAWRQQNYPLQARNAPVSGVNAGVVQQSATSAVGLTENMRLESVEVKPLIPTTEKPNEKVSKFTQCPTTLAESREQLQNGRSRVFVIFLDINQVEASASGKVRQPLINALNQLIAPDDLVAIMTPLMTARDLSFTRWTDATEGFIRKYWDWGQRDRATGADPREEDYKQCYPGMKSGREGCGDDRGVADKMIARRREKQTMDALQGLTDYLQTAREERKAVLVISDGWLLYRPDDTLRARTDCAPPKPKITMDPRTGKVTTKEPERAPATRSDVLCETDRLQLAAIDNRARMQDLQSQANRANVSFYPIDPRGLPATDVDTGCASTGLPARGQTAVPTPAADWGCCVRARSRCAIWRRPPTASPLPLRTISMQGSACVVADLSSGSTS